MPTSGHIVSINIAHTDGGATIPLQTAELRAGKGIVGDRKFRAQGTEPKRELTLVESEQVEHFNAATGLEIGAADTRRNIETCGISLNDLVGEEFMVGAVRVKGIELCHPCSHLGNLLAGPEIAAPEIVRVMANRAGLRACILGSGTVHVGDTIRIEDPM